jgi:hypothetical protein
MKNIKNIALLLLLFIIVSCEKVIEVDLNTSEPKLVIDASIKWKKGTLGNQQTIKLSTTGNFYSNVIPTVSNAIVFITDSNDMTFNFIESGVQGEYVCSNFLPVLNETYSLTVVQNNQTYIATETLIPVPVIDSIKQKNNTGFGGKNIEIKSYFKDNSATNDYYLYKVKTNYNSIPNYRVFYDLLFQGNTFYAIYTDDKLKTGDLLQLELSGISKRYFNYMNILISLAGSTGGSPFQSPPATVRGNIINQTNEANYALGYFSLSEMDSKNYSVE